jgi:hypothetical protein
MFYTFAPLEIENKNKLENTKKKTLHKIAVVCSVSLSFTALFASVFNMYYAAVIVFTMFFTAVFMLPVIIKIQMEGGA